MYYGILKQPIQANEQQKLIIGLSGNGWQNYCPFLYLRNHDTECENIDFIKVLHPSLQWFSLIKKSTKPVGKIFL